MLGWIIIGLWLATSLLMRNRITTATQHRCADLNITLTSRWWYDVLFYEQSIVISLVCACYFANHECSLTICGSVNSQFHKLLCSNKVSQKGMNRGEIAFMDILMWIKGRNYYQFSVLFDISIGIYDIMADIINICLYFSDIRCMWIIMIIIIIIIIMFYYSMITCIFDDIKNPTYRPDYDDNWRSPTSYSMAFWRSDT